MKRLTAAGLVLAAIAAGIGGYWYWQVSADMPARVGADEILYYKDPDGVPSYSLEPRATADGRPYAAVRKGEDIDVDEPAAPAASGSRKVIYYRNPMGLPDISSTPKKDSMGMEYIPVYEGEDNGGSTVKVSAGKLQQIGMTSEPAMLRIISEPVRAPGTIQLDERKISVVTLRTEAFIESVGDVTTGSEVKKGQPLMRMYSPAIASAAAEYAALLQSPRAGDIPAGTRQRLLNLGVTDAYMAAVERDRKAPLTFTWPAPRDGIVLERNVIDGQRAQPGEVLFRVADHSVVWAMVDVAERDLGLIKENQPVTLKARSFPDRTFTGKVALLYPHLNPATRTVRVRIELTNKDLLLRPDMYVEATIDSGEDTPVLAVPDSAVIDSGDRQLVFIDKGGGSFEPRPVKLGRSGLGFTEIADGLSDGEVVVTSANFLIDAESNLKSALKALTAGAKP